MELAERRRERRLRRRRVGNVVDRLREDDRFRREARAVDLLALAFGPQLDRDVVQAVRRQHERLERGDVAQVDLPLTADPAPPVVEARRKRVGRRALPVERRVVTPELRVDDAHRDALRPLDVGLREVRRSLARLDRPCATRAEGHLQRRSFVGFGGVGRLRGGSYTKVANETGFPLL